MKRDVRWSKNVWKRGGLKENASAEIVLPQHLRTVRMVRPKVRTTSATTLLVELILKSGKAETFRCV